VGGFSDGIAFATFTTEKNQINKNQITCHQCGKKGHYADELDICQGQAKPESCAVAAVTTKNNEEENGNITNFRILWLPSGSNKL